MPVLVVVRLEEIDVDHRDRESRAALRRAPPCLLKHLAECAAVEYARQPIDARQHFEACICSR